MNETGWQWREKPMNRTGRDHQQTQSEAEWKQLKPETMCRSVQIDWQVMPGIGTTVPDRLCVLRRTMQLEDHSHDPPDADRADVPAGGESRRRRRRAAVKNTGTLVLFYSSLLAQHVARVTTTTEAAYVHITHVIQKQAALFLAQRWRWKCLWG